MLTECSGHGLWLHLMNVSLQHVWDYMLVSEVSGYTPDPERPGPLLQCGLGHSPQTTAGWGAATRMAQIQFKAFSGFLFHQISTKNTVLLWICKAAATAQRCSQPAGPRW